METADMEALRLYRIEAVIVDDRLTKEQIAKRLGSFIISMEVAEVDPLAGYSKFIKAPAKETKTSKATAKRATRKRHGNTGKMKAKTRERIDLITKALGNKSMRIEDIATKTGLDIEVVRYTVEAGERHRLLAIKMAPNKGTRPIRMVSVLK